MSPSVLVVDDETALLDTLRVLLRRAGYEVRTARTVAEAQAALEEAPPDLLVVDIRLPDGDGLAVLRGAHERDPAMPVVLMTAQATLESAIRAVNEGAYYYLLKPFGTNEFVALCRRALEARQLRRENQELRSLVRRLQVPETERPVGQSRAFREVLRLAETVAPTEATILLTGESGTGKEVLARYIHRLSARASGPFLSINCAALPEGLLESELFGHVRGAFTGAVRDKKGLLAAARGGTFFLDEVGEMSPATQAKLLRALQEREITPVGATSHVPIDVRFIAATNKDLEEEVRRGAFRRDLFYRLNVVAIPLPPLRERRDDIPLLAEHFLTRWAHAHDRPAPTLAPEALEVLCSYHWPGNVRELENALEYALVLSRGETIRPEHLPARVREPARAPLVSDRPPPNPTLEAIERAYIFWVLHAEGGNKTRAAEVLGIDPSTLHRKLRRYGLA